MIGDNSTKVEYFSFVILGICMLDIFMSLTSSISLSIEDYKRSGVIEELVAAKIFTMLHYHPQYTQYFFHFISF